VPAVRLKRVAAEQLAALPDHARDEVEQLLLRIQADPERVGIPLLGRLRGRWRARVGGYRVLYRIIDDGRVVIVDAIRLRRDAY
jgi:mRNA-degrading endonuclease RelE of RelBE toxin-antitoxin system